MSDQSPAEGKSLFPDTGLRVEATDSISHQPDRTERAFARCDANGKTIFGLLLKYGLFTILTLGIYRFWAKTHIRRYFWNSVELAGDRFEYHGTPKELFIGFLLVLVILSPLFVLLSMTEVLVLTYGVSALFAIQVVYFGALFVLINVAVFRMLRYRLSRTSWRGIRFGLTGSTWAYVGKALIWTLVTIVTLGIAYPWMRNALIGYRANNSKFGSVGFEYRGSGRSLFGQAWAPALFVIVPIIGMILHLGSELATLASAAAAQDPDQIGPEILVKIAAFYGWMFVVSIGWVIGFSWYRIREFRYVTRNLLINGVSFDPELSTVRVLVRGLLVTLLSVIVLGVIGGIMGTVLFSGLTGAFMAAGGPESIAQITIAIYIFYFVFGMFAFVISQAIWVSLFTVPILRQICDGMTINNPSALEGAVQMSGSDQALTGEGLADALDVGAL